MYLLRKILQVRMKTSEIKTADSTSEECFGVSVAKISAQSDKI